jgi:transcription elongation factor Elf1
MTQEEKEKIKKALEERQAKNPCPRCNNEKFSLTDGYFVQSLQSEARGIIIGGLGLPSVILVCTRCGFMSQHALGSLGLLEISNSDPTEKKPE